MPNVIFENPEIHVEIHQSSLMNEGPQSDHTEKQHSLMNSMFIMSIQLSNIYQLRSCQA